MDETTKILLPLLLSPALGVVAAFLTTHYKLKQEHRHAQENEKENIRLKFLNPLLVSCEDLLGRLIDIKRRRKDPKKQPDMQRWFRDIKRRMTDEPHARALWVNDEGYFAISSLYITAVYFHYASVIRRSFPFIELSSGGASALLSHLSYVRISLGGKFGIWEVMQDSLGAYLATADGNIKTYRQFCEQLANETDSAWFNRLIDFYSDIHLKLDDHLDNIEIALKQLISFLNDNLKIPPTEYCLTEESIVQLRKRTIPAQMVNQLSSLVGRGYMKEVDFVDAVVECIGQDGADDYKPSILKCAQRLPI
jgi:hypothetical protein